MATNNKHLTDIELVDKLIDKTMDLYEKESIRGRDIERLNNIKEEILSRMYDENTCECDCCEEENIMTKNHPEWEAFCSLLIERMNYKNCDAKTLTQAKYVLKNYFPEIDIENSLEYFRNNGGYCDCEILLNVT